MKTNHRRNFVDTYHDYSAGPMRIRNPAVRCEISGVAVQPKHIGFDFSNGHRGKAKSKRGMKKFVRTRVRFHENTATKKLANDYNLD